MSPRRLAALGLLYVTAHGLLGGLEFRYAGNRYLNKRNTALAPGFGRIDAGIGYRLAHGEIRLDGRDLTDQRDPIAESELEDAQHHRVPARRVDVGYSVRF